MAAKMGVIHDEHHRRAAIRVPHDIVGMYHWKPASQRCACMAHINYVPDDAIPPDDRVPDTNNILRIHGVHTATMRHHYELYAELMRGPGPLTRAQREMIAVVVSAENGCHY
jgi:hypothetical protein